MRRRVFENCRDRYATDMTHRVVPNVFATLALVACAACGDSVPATTDGGGPGVDGGRSDGGPRVDAGGGADGGPRADGGGVVVDGGGVADVLAALYPGDVGLAGDPSVVWTEDFEEGSLAIYQARYDQVQNPGGHTLVPDVPAASRGAASVRLTAGGAAGSATDFYKSLSPGFDELYIRYYAKYEAGVTWHHTGVWVGGYDPPMSYPSPMAGLRPNGDDRFSISLEPIGAGTNVRLDFYNYWMTMHSWMETPMGSTAYYGNALVHDPSLRAPDDTWFCVELHIKINPDPASAAGAELGLWINDTSVQQFSDTTPLGYWVRDKFCPDAATGTECTMYRPTSPTLEPLDLRFRSVGSLKLNSFWPQNYITEGGAGNVWYDDMVVATRRVGCIR